jgi:hypothetical protein
MPALTKKPTTRDPVRSTEYRGKQTKTGNSSGFRFESALFKSHPEFNGEVTAHVIAPGRLLVTAEPMKQENADPVMASFLAFLADDITHAPHQIRPLDSHLAGRIDQLVDGIDVAPDAPLGDEAIL